MGWTCGKNGGGTVDEKTGALRVGSRRRRGRPKLRWEDGVKLDLAGVGGEWTMRERDSGSGND